VYKRQELGNINLSDIEGTKAVMDAFLVKIAFSMETSIIGIILSVSTNILNTFLSPEKLFIDSIDRFEGCLDILWNRCSNNKLPGEIEAFDEHKDPIDALAEEAVKSQLAKAKGLLDDTLKDAAIGIESVTGEDPEEIYDGPDANSDDYEEAS